MKYIKYYKLFENTKINDSDRLKDLVDSYHSSLDYEYRAKYMENINYQNNNGITAFLWAIYKFNNISLLKKLINMGSDINITTNNGENSLCWAFDDSTIEVMKFLIDEGVDICTNKLNFFEFMEEYIDRFTDYDKDEYIEKITEITEYIKNNRPEAYKECDKIKKSKDFNL